MHAQYGDAAIAPPNPLHPAPAPQTRRWQGDNGPRKTDLEGTQNLIKAAPRDLKRFVFVTSAGVERQDQFPWIILNAFGARPGGAAAAASMLLGAAGVLGWRRHRAQPLGPHATP